MTNSDRLKQIIALVGAKQDQSFALKVRSLGTAPIDLWTDAQFAGLRDRLFVEWAAKFPCWRHSQHRLNAFKKLLREHPEPMDDRQLFHLWKESISDRLSKISMD